VYIGPDLDDEYVRNLRPFFNLVPFRDSLYRIDALEPSGLAKKLGTDKESVEIIEKNLLFLMNAVDALASLK
jgi:hypothetical protein